MILRSLLQIGTYNPPFIGLFSVKMLDFKPRFDDLN